MLRPRRAIGPAPRGRQAGLTLVELMVGITVGLFVVAGASLVITTQLGENRRMLLETQLQQDLRASMDIITRELRRAGYWDLARSSLWQPGAPTVSVNPLTAVDPDVSTQPRVTFYFARSPGDRGPFGFRLDNGRVQAIVGGSWQELTDPRVLRVTRFDVTPVSTDVAQVPCPKDCAGGGTACWPTVVSRRYEIAIEAQSRSDPNVRRSLSSVVQLRNDWLRFNDPANPTLVCPA